MFGQRCIRVVVWWFGSVLEYQGVLGCLLMEIYISISHPSKLTWHWKIRIFNRKYIFKWWVFHCHVSFPGNTSYPYFLTLPQNITHTSGAQFSPGTWVWYQISSMLPTDTRDLYQTYIRNLANYIFNCTKKGISVDRTWTFLLTTPCFHIFIFCWWL